LLSQIEVIEASRDGTARKKGKQVEELPNVKARQRFPRYRFTATVIFNVLIGSGPREPIQTRDKSSARLKSAEK